MDLVYGQHPKRAMPLRSWPTYGRVGGLVVVITTKRRYGGNAVGAISDKEIIDEIEFRELSEFIEIIVISGFLE